MDTLSKGKSTYSQNSAYQFREFMGQPKPIPEPPWESVAQGWEALTYSPVGLSIAGSLCHILCLPLRCEDSSARQASRFSFRAP